MNKRMVFRRAMITLGILLLTFVIILLIYIAYIFLNYQRIEDKLDIEVHNTAEQENKKAETGKEYTIITYNVGFGAYTSDFSFFMDGGSSSWAKSEESVKTCINEDCKLLQSYSPDIIFLQEVDYDSTRSYHVNEADMICDFFPKYAHNYVVNYNSSFLMYPLKQPHGASKSGMLTMTDLQMVSALRRSLPVSDSVYKILDMDRCYSITRISVENGRELVLFHVHLSAYTDNADIVTRQILMLVEDMKREVDIGNYVICGGDFNQDMLGNSSSVYGTDSRENSWAKPFPEELLSEGLRIASNDLTEKERYSLAPSCRNADSPYVEGKSFVIFIDDFILSDNVEMISLQTIDNDFSYSDHNPVMIKVRLLEEGKGVKEWIENK